jgi:hypothetical protein
MVFYTYNNIGTISIKLWQSGGKVCLAKKNKPAGFCL